MQTHLKVVLAAVVGLGIGVCIMLCVSIGTDGRTTREESLTRELDSAKENAQQTAKQTETLRGELSAAADKLSRANTVLAAKTEEAVAANSALAKMRSEHDDATRKKADPEPPTKKSPDKKPLGFSETQAVKAVSRDLAVKPAEEGYDIADGKVRLLFGDTENGGICSATAMAAESFATDLVRSVALILLAAEPFDATEKESLALWFADSLEYLEKHPRSQVKRTFKSCVVTFWCLPTKDTFLLVGSFAAE